MISRSGAGNSAQSCHYDEEDVTEEDEGCNEDGCWDDGMGWQGRYRFWGLPYVTSAEKGGDQIADNQRMGRVEGEGQKIAKMQ